MREEVDKFLFIGLAEDQAAFFKQAQERGIIHFIDPQAAPSMPIPEEMQRLTAAIKVLRGLPTCAQAEEVEGWEPADLVEAILRVHAEWETACEERRLLELERSRIAVFGDFSLEDVAYIEQQGRCAMQFFCARPALLEGVALPEGFLFITAAHGLDYYLAIHAQPVTHNHLVEMKFAHSLSELNRQHAHVSALCHDLEHELRGYAPYHRFLHDAMIGQLNRYHLARAQGCSQAALDGGLFAVEGWVPVPHRAQLEALVADLSVHAEKVAVQPGEVVPTYLENRGLARIGEDLVHIYDTPSSTDKDPSLWVLAGFALFFAFIIGDAGYGLIYLAGALFLRQRYPHLQGTAKRVLNLFTLLSVGCIFWGTLMTSFWGMEIGIDNPIRRFSLLQSLAEQLAGYHLAHQDAVLQEWVLKYPEVAALNTPQELIRFLPEGHRTPVILNEVADNILFELALFIGVVHLITALLRYAGRQPHQIGWVLFLVGAYLYFPFYLGIPSFLNFVGGIDLTEGGVVGRQLMGIGVGMAWLLSIIKNGWSGLFEIAVLIQVFADTFSYLRLYALGLAGGIVSGTINQIAAGLPLVLGLLLVLVSHALNIGLSTMSGVLHGLRLNYLEWYHYSFEGGGRRFRPLQLLHKKN